MANPLNHKIAVIPGDGIGREVVPEGIRVLARSSVYESEPVGEVPDQRDFYNAAVKAETSLEPRELRFQVLDFRFDDGREKSFELKLDPKTLTLQSPERGSSPNWVPLGNHRCLHHRSR